MNLNKMLLIVLSTLIFSGCFLTERDNDASDTPPADGTTGGTTKTLDSSTWVNENGAYLVDMTGAVADGSTFTVTFSNPAFTCSCDMALTGTEASGTYTSDCVKLTGTESSGFTCRLYEAPKIANGASEECTSNSSTTAAYTYDGVYLNFGNCGGAGGLTYQ